VKYFMMWREDFEDYKGWFTEDELRGELQRLSKIESGDGEFEMSDIVIIAGQDVTKEWVKE
jgi:hypothetical protein